MIPSFWVARLRRTVYNLEQWRHGTPAKSRTRLKDIPSPPCQVIKYADARLGKWALDWRRNRYVNNEKRYSLMYFIIIIITPVSLCKVLCTWTDILNLVADANFWMEIYAKYLRFFSKIIRIFTTTTKIRKQNTSLASVCNPAQVRLSPNPKWRKLIHILKQWREK